MKRFLMAYGAVVLAAAGSYAVLVAVAVERVGLGPVLVALGSYEW